VTAMENAPCAAVGRKGRCLVMMSRFLSGQRPGPTLFGQAYGEAEAFDAEVAEGVAAAVGPDLAFGGAADEPFAAAAQGPPPFVCPGRTACLGIM